MRRRNVIIEALAPFAPTEGYRDSQTDHGIGVRVAVSSATPRTMAAIAVLTLVHVGIAACWASIAFRSGMDWQRGGWCCVCCAIGTMAPFAGLLYATIVRWRNVLIVECRRGGVLTRRDGPLPWMYRQGPISVRVADILGVEVALESQRDRGAVVLREASGTYGLFYELAADDAFAIAREIQRILPRTAADGSASG